LSYPSPPSPVTLANGRRLGAGEPVYIIAEIGSNHDGSLDKAKALIRLARDAGSDAAKFQSFQAHTLINRYQQTDSGPWIPHPAWDTLERLAVPIAWHAELNDYCRSLGIDFLSAPFDLERLQLLIDLNVPAIKLASGEITNLPFLRAVAASGKPILLSTGASTLGECEQALTVLHQSGCLDVVLLHCVSHYPTSFAEANIRAMANMAHTFGVSVGYSDHTAGHAVPLGAVAMGACVIEKHLTDDTTLIGPDHGFALDGLAFAAMAQDIRSLEAALGNGRKQPQPAEDLCRTAGRRAIYTTRPLVKGTVLAPDMLHVVRESYPGGIEPECLNDLMGLTLQSDMDAYRMLTWQAVCAPQMANLHR
jgi:sialic acid synthase SpsE